MDWESFFFKRDNYESRRDLAYNNETFNLDKAAELFQRAGRPAERIPKIHVAGTNGKGSTCLYLEQIALTAGQTTGVFISPHVEHPGERFRINGHSASELQLAQAASFLKTCIPDKDRPTTFELLFLAALFLFERAGSSLVIVETGVGGRLDTTNIITPILSVITPIALDHMALLGKDLSSIASEKAGIIKPAIPLVQALQPPEADRILEERCRALESPRLIAHPHTVEEQGLAGTRLVRQCGDVFWTCMCGREQGENLELALVAAEQAGLVFEPARVEKRLETARLPARIEVFGEEPLLIVDGGHNPQALTRLGRLLRDVRRKRSIHVLCGMMSDKDCSANMKIIADWAERITTLRLPGPRSASAHELAALVPDGRATPVEGEIHELIHTFCTNLAPDTIGVLCGSFVLAGIGRSMLKGRS